MRRGRWTAGVAALLVVLVASACGQSDGTRAEGSGALDIRTLADTTDAASTARFEGTYRPSPESGAPGGGFEGEIDFANGNSVTRWTTRSSIAPGGAEGAGGPDASESRVVDGYTYLQVPVPTGGDRGILNVPATPWYRMRTPGSSAVLLPMGSSPNVTAYLELLESMGAHLETSGTDTVRGAPTTRYRITPTGPANVPAELQALGSDFSEGSRSPSIELWVDAAGRLRRLRTDLGDQGSGGVYEVELFDFGAPVSIEAPPPDQVTTQPSSTPDPDAYELVASGRDGGTDWKVYTAPIDAGRCLAVEADVAEYFTAVMGSQGGLTPLDCSSSSSSSSGGSGSETPTQERSRPTEPRAVPLVGGRALLLGEVPDGTTEVTLRLRDGATQRVAPVSGWFGAVLANDAVAKAVEFAMPSGASRCLLKDGFGYSCGPDLDGSGSQSSSSSSSSGSVSGTSSATTTVPPTARSSTTTGR